MNDILWVEKYRPQTILDCILQNELKSTFQQFVENEEIPNLLLTGTAGVDTFTGRAGDDQFDFSLNASLNDFDVLDK